MSETPEIMKHSFWQKGCDDARAGMPSQWHRYDEEVRNAHLTGWQRSLLWGGYLNGYNYGLWNKKAP